MRFGLHDSSVDAWWIFDQNGVVTLSSLKKNVQPDLSQIEVSSGIEDIKLKVSYGSLFSPFRQQASSQVTATAKFSNAQNDLSAIQVVISLNDVRAKIFSSAKLLFIFFLCSSTTIFLFGWWLIWRNILKPIDGLTVAIIEVENGNYEQTVQVTGPREIGALAGTFNRMTKVLKGNRAAIAEHIISLEKVNGELQEVRNELVHSERMSSVGNLAAGMAHEIGNPLAAIIGYLDLMGKTSKELETRELVDRVTLEAERIDQLVRDLLDYSGSQADLEEIVDPLSVVRGSFALVQNQGFLGCCQFLDLGPKQLPLVRLIPHRLQQVVVNLILNAVDASPDGGRLTLEAGFRDGRVWFSVADEGEGLSSEAAKNIFDPFYTTKASGRGLGLSVSYRIIKEAGGRIAVKSGPGIGSTFTVVLPQTE